MNTAPAEEVPDGETPDDDPATAAARARVYEWLRAHPYGDQDENGIDLSLLRANLKLTPRERLDKHQSALNSIRRIRRATDRRNAASGHTPSP